MMGQPFRFLLDEALRRKTAAKQVYNYLRLSFPKSVLKRWVKNAHWEAQDVPVDQIRLDRKLSDVQLIQKNRRRWLAGNDPHPIVLMDLGNQTPGKRYAIADGHHRLLGAMEAGRKTIPAWVGTPTPESGPFPVQLILSTEARLAKAQHPAGHYTVDGGTP